MQRQSLGSPSTKLHLHDPNSISSSPIKSLSFGEIIQVEDEEEEQTKKLKLKKPNSIKINTKPETFIHLIPMLTLLCFLILYLSSHNPSSNDMAQFNAFNHHLHNPEEIVGESISELERVMEIKKGNILTIRSLKNIKQQQGGGVNVRVTGGGLGKQRRFHRKFGIV